MTASTTIHHRGLGRRTLAGIAAAIAVTGSAAIALTAGEDPPAGTSATSSLSPESQRYVDWVVSASPEDSPQRSAPGP